MGTQFTRPLIAVVTTLLTVGCGTAAQAVTPLATTASTVSAASATSPAFNIGQAISDGAQLNTIAFDGLGFLTGTIASDSFFPPGKVADFWGFQYLRDNDPSSMGHNTDFLTRASLAMLNTLTADQRAQLLTLANAQVSDINSYGMKRYELMTANRRLLAGDLPAGTTGLSSSAVQAWSASLYQLDGSMSVARARVMGSLLASLDSSQQTTLDAMVGKGMTSWPVTTEPSDLRGLTHDQNVAVMTYAGDMFSWYAGSVTADTYFCPERHGTYFGSFYLKDAPAVGNPGYSIGTQITGESGAAFLAALTPAQAKTITDIIPAQRATLASIVDVRTQISTELRKAMTGGTVDSSVVDALMVRYGQLDGFLAATYATAFATVNSTLTTAQRTTLAALRTALIAGFSPTGGYLYATPIDVTTITTTDSLFGQATILTPTTPTTPSKPTAVIATAVNSASRLFVDVNPSRGSGYWSFRVQSLTSGRWTTRPTTYRTQGTAETATINLPKGTYRVIVLAKGSVIGTSARVTLVR